MGEMIEFLVGAALIGSGATAVIDGWGVLRAHVLGTPSLDYGLVGRWLIPLARGQYRHFQIAASDPAPRERLIGWAAHYLIGIAFAAVLLAIWGLDWLHSPRIGPALIVGIGSAAAPFLIMQPGMGLGIAAHRAPRPNLARLNTLLTHAVFGVGLYVAGWIVRLVQWRGAD